MTGRLVSGPPTALIAGAPFDKDGAPFHAAPVTGAVVAFPSWRRGRR